MGKKTKRTKIFGTNYFMESVGNRTFVVLWQDENILDAHAVDSLDGTKSRNISEMWILQQDYSLITIENDIPSSELLDNSCVPAPRTYFPNAVNKVVEEDLLTSRFLDNINYYYILINISN